VIPCTPTIIIDADTWHCAEGPTIRAAAISALERNGRCNSSPYCATMRHAQAKPIVERLILRRRLTCVPHARSYARIVATCTFQNGTDVGCSIVATGAAVEWPKYRVRYRLRGCAR
jgi:endonuclease YncB( thermonuclease family)